MLSIFDRDVSAVGDAAPAREKSSVRVQVARSRGRGAVELVAVCFDPQTGRVDTFQIALWVTDAGRRDFALAARAYAAIEAQLLARSPGDVARFNQDLVEAMRSCAAAGKKRVLRNNPVLALSWEPSRVAEDARQVWPSGLRSLLESHGIAVSAIERTPPRGRTALPAVTEV